MAKKLKTSSDYAQFYFRISDEDKVKLDAKIEKILTSLKAKIEDGDLQPKRNDLILRALKRGLVQIERELVSK